jgi:hypothetical protein
MTEDSQNALKKEILETISEKFDIEAVAQMVEQLDFSKQLNESLQQSFQRIQNTLQQKDQVILHLQHRIENAELDIALLKRLLANPCSFAQVQQVVVPNLVSEPSDAPRNTRQEVHPPDLSRLREMTVAEPANKFVP